MKLTKETLKRIIKEELSAVLNESDEDVAKIVDYMKNGIEGFRSALQLADTMEMTSPGITQQALQGLMNELNPEKIANDYEEIVWSWPESVDYHYGTPAFQSVNIETGGAGKVYHIPRRGEIYENFMEDAQDGLLTELSEIMNDADTQELASALESVGLLDTMTSKFMDLMLQGNEAVVSVTPEKISISDEGLSSLY